MFTRLLFIVSMASVAGAICLAPASAAEGPSIRVLVSNGLKASMDDLHTAWEASVGHPLDIRYNSTASVKKSIEAGEPRQTRGKRSRDCSD